MSMNFSWLLVSFKGYLLYMLLIEYAAKKLPKTASAPRSNVIQPDVQGEGTTKTEKGGCC